MARVLVFDVWSRFAYFRRHYTTTTASSHPFITRSAIEGLVGAICGYSSEDYPGLLWNAQIAISLIKQKDEDKDRITKLPFGVSYTTSDFWTQRVGRYLKSGGGSLEHTPVPRSVEILIEPSYRIYFSSNLNKVLEELSTNLKGHSTYYTPYLGSSNMIANFDLVDDCEFSAHTAKEDEEIRIHSIIPFFTRIPQVKVETGFRYAIEQNIPLHVDKERKPSGYYSAVYSPILGQPILSRGISYSVIHGSKNEVNVVFIPSSSPSAS